jgi:hypothetical protein
MDTAVWLTTFGLFAQHPILIIAVVVVGLAAFGAAWSLRGHIDKERIGILEERLRLAGDHQPGGNHGPANPHVTFPGPADPYLAAVALIRCN